MTKCVSSVFAQAMIMDYPNIAHLWKWLHDNQQSLSAVVATLTVVGFVWKVVPTFRRRWEQYRTIRQLPQTMGAQLYSPQEIFRATRYYIESHCQSIDPSGAEEFRQTFATRESAFNALDHLLLGRSEHRHTLILADAGMGKSSLLINYYARHIRNRNRSRQFSITLLPLGISNVQEQIAKVPNRENTVVFLDALDEDTLAIFDHKGRLAELLQWTAGFRHVVITCRTQFFLSDEEIPKDVGIVKVGVISAGESRTYLLHKLYLSPFNDDQITHYLRKRFPIWQYSNRRKGKRLVSRMGDLSARPMLLAHIDDLLSSQKRFDYSFQIYDEMVEAWLTREERFVPRAALREFCELVAVDIFRNREARKSEKIGYAELFKIADSIAPEVANWQASQDTDRSVLANRSLLNRDAEGNRKFSHRSIMEYLFIARLLKCSERYVPCNWTDQMKTFWHEMFSEAIRNFTTATRLFGDVINSETLRLLQLELGKAARTGIVSALLTRYVRLASIYPVSDIGGHKGIFYEHLPLELRWQMGPADVWRRVTDNFIKERPGSLPQFIMRLPNYGEAAMIHCIMAIQHGFFIDNPGILYSDDGNRQSHLQFEQCLVLLGAGHLPKFSPRKYPSWFVWVEDMAVEEPPPPDIRHY